MKEKFSSMVHYHLVITNLQFFKQLCGRFISEWILPIKIFQFEGKGLHHPSKFVVPAHRDR